MFVELGFSCRQLLYIKLDSSHNICSGNNVLLLTWKDESGEDLRAETESGFVSCGAPNS
jgi:hypothetical protein